MVAPMVLDGPINSNWFEAYVGQLLVANFGLGDVVIMDNFSSHNRACVRQAIEAAEGRLLFSPPLAFAGAGSIAETSTRSQGLLPPQGHAPKGRFEKRVRAMVTYEQAPRPLRAARMRKRLQLPWTWPKLKGKALSC
jgi:hypothetical protein